MRLFRDCGNSVFWQQAMIIQGYNLHNRCKFSCVKDRVVIVLIYPPKKANI